MNSQSPLAAQLANKEYRDAFVASQIRIGLPMQCRALRESRDWTQPRLAELAGMSQPRISEIERPGERNLNLDTLLRLASAFDVAVQVRFVPFSHLVDDDDTLDLSDFYVPPFEEDIAALKRREESMKSVIVMGAHRAAAGNEMQPIFFGAGATQQEISKPKRSALEIINEGKDSGISLRNAS